MHVTPDRIPVGIGSNRMLHFVFDSDGDSDPDTDTDGSGSRWEVGILPPRWGWKSTTDVNPPLTPWATVFRPSGPGSAWGVSLTGATPSRARDMPTSASEWQVPVPLEESGTMRLFGLR